MTQRLQNRVCFDDLNKFLDSLKQDDDLVEIHEEINPRFEVGAVLKTLGEKDGPAALFSNVAGFPGRRIAGNVVGHRRRLAKAFGVKEDELVRCYLERKRLRVPAVQAPDAPVKAVTLKGDQIDLLQLLPAVVYHERDVSPYLTCAVTFAKDPETGRQSMGLHRIQIQSGQKMGICLETPPLVQFFRRAWEMKRPLEVAVIIGPDPLILVASVTWCPEGEDKIEIAGGFRGKPVEMVRCASVDLRVPAHPQYVIEGRIQPGEVAREGIFGDSSGIYVEAQSPVIHVTSVSHRKKPIYQALQTWSREDDALFNLCFGSDLLEEMRRPFPFVRDLHLISGTVCGHVVLSVAPCTKPMLRNAMVAALIRNPFVKMATFVDEDIDIRNHSEVAWAVTTRFQADRDLVIVPGIQGTDIDPSSSADGSTCKIALDATYPKEQMGRYEKIDIPEESRRRALKILEKSLGRS